MMKKYLAGQIYIAKYLLRWTLIVFPVSVVIGILVAFFLWLLDMATTWRWQNLWLIFFLPVAGVFIYWLYKQFGRNSERGNNLIIDEIHEPGGGVPAGMTPLILFTTVLTHLFGGSAGREGTAVQMGGSISSVFAQSFKLSEEDRKILLMCGMSAGFGAVFGTPVAGAVFALEVIAIGRIQYNALVPCLLSGILAHITCISCGIHHTEYRILYNTQGGKGFMPYIHLDGILLIKVIVIGALFGITGLLFATLTRYVKVWSGRFIRKEWLISVAGAAIILLLSYSLGTFNYLGLGVTNPDGVSIVSAFHAGGATYFSWMWKIILTAVTLGTGFKGGEVTPLFFIGATMGNALATLSGSPVDLFAGLGFIAVFAGAANTPLACTIMGIELFGGENIVYYAIACFSAYYFSGHSGIYYSQRIAISKFPAGSQQ